MKKLVQFSRNLTTNKVFELSIMAVIIINSVLIGVETYTANPTIALIQQVILGIFTVEIVLRMIAATSVKSFFTDAWNVFDLSLVLIGYIPESVFANASLAMALRVLRVFRVLRLLRASKEVKVIVTVLVKSMSALLYNVIMFFIFLYLFAIVGVSLFKLPSPENLSGETLQNYNEFVTKCPNAPSNSPDPFGSLGESMFTLFRELTGEDWTDIRYNLISASDYNVISVGPAVITGYHVIWFVLSAFLLLNLVVAAIVNNYQAAMEAEENKPEDTEKKE